MPGSGSLYKKARARASFNTYEAGTRPCFLVLHSALKEIPLPFRFLAGLLD